MDFERAEIPSTNITDSNLTKKFELKSTNGIRNVNIVFGSE